MYFIYLLFIIFPYCNSTIIEEYFINEFSDQYNSEEIIKDLNNKYLVKLNYTNYIFNSNYNNDFSGIVVIDIYDFINVEYTNLTFDSHVSGLKYIIIKLLKRSFKIFRDDFRYIIINNKIHNICFNDDGDRKWISVSVFLDKYIRIKKQEIYRNEIEEEFIVTKKENKLIYLPIALTVILIILLIMFCILKYKFNV